MLQEYGAGPNVQGAKGPTPLRLALESKDLNSDIIRFLLGAGASLDILLRKWWDFENFWPSWGQFPISMETLHIFLHAAASQSILSHLPRPFICLAAIVGDAEILRSTLSLCKKDGHANQQENKDAVTGGHTEIVELLLTHNIDVNEMSSFTGKTALHFAASGGHEDITRLLLEAGADVHKADNEIKTPLCQAVKEVNNLTSRQIIDRCRSGEAEITAEWFRRLFEPRIQAIWTLVEYGGELSEEWFVPRTLFAGDDTRARLQYLERGAAGLDISYAVPAHCGTDTDGMVDAGKEGIAGSSDYLDACWV
ncbi:ankyrin repeat domain-containing protein [Aspergillus puulaauensis]|uniref:Ankyrin repeat-containing domain protein n=1 Tax=Aspergillus puulaauensis TaxID=1220207 RepID=A0A7R8ALG5_9EURO|nr:uncharacterized protein APUU_22072A [Aspergillus puulaauensis]BCS21640.1 hypothetical protein APUU_22072A [Aspergillus puulaauensis]